MQAAPAAEHPAIVSLRALVDSTPNQSTFADWWAATPDIEALDCREGRALIMKLGAIRGLKESAKMLSGQIAALRQPEPEDEADDDTPCDSEAEIDGQRLVVPWPYIVGSAVSVRTKIRGKVQIVQIAPRVIAPVESVRDISTGAHHVTVAWAQTAGGWHRQTVPRGTIADSRAIGVLADTGAPVSSVTARDVVGWMSAAEERGQIPNVEGSSQLGWYGSRYLTGTGCIGGDIRFLGDEGSRAYASGWGVAGSLAEWRKHVWDPIQPHPIVVLTMYAALAPVLLGLIPGTHGFVLDLNGRNSGGKSSAQKIACSIWADESSIFLSWKSTRVGAERAAVVLRHHPLILDDTKNLQHAPEQIAEVIYMVTGSKGKLRGAPNGGMAAPANVSTVLISSGEQPASSFTQDAGARARCLSLVGLPMSTNPEPVVIAAREHYGHIGPAVVRWITEDFDTRRAWLIARYGEHAARVRAALDAGGVGGRVAGHVALLATAASVMQAACGLQVNTEALNAATRAAAHTIEDADVFRTALEHVRSWFERKQGDWNAPGVTPRDIIAIMGENDEYVWAHRSAVAQALDDGGWKYDSITPEWVARGWYSKGSTVHRIPGSQQSNRMYRLTWPA